MHACFHAPGSPGSPEKSEQLLERKVHQGGQSKTVIVTLVYLLVTWFTDRDLLAIEHTKDLIEADWLPLLGQFAEMSNVVHHDLRLLVGFPTDATGFPSFRACSHSGRQNEHVHIGLASSLKGFSVLGPILIEKETNFSVAFPVFSCHFNAEVLAKARNTFLIEVLCLHARVLASEKRRIC